MMQTPRKRNQTSADEDKSVYRFMTALVPGWTLSKWFEWPPDLFALTSMVMNCTGLYRFVVSQPKLRDAPWGDREWQDGVEGVAVLWREWINTSGDLGNERSLPDPLEALRERLEEAARDTMMQDLLLPSKHGKVERGMRDAGSTLLDREQDDEGKTQASNAMWELCCCLIELHAVADYACVGFGMPVAPNEKNAAIHYLANLSLTTRGSLARFDKHYGVVLPKMRLPQTGLTLRSLSHHLTFHQSEVEVSWHTLPWVNQSENTINMLLVPWPHEMKPTWFKAKPHPGTVDRIGHSRFFSYEPDGRFDTSLVVNLLRESLSKVRRIHLIVLPELALTHEELEELKSVLEQEVIGRQTSDQVPMLISGVRTTKESTESVHERKNGRDRSVNRIVLSVFFAGKWYDLAQDKHHRWRLDRRQIKQYNLGGSLSGGSAWWECFDVQQRQLSFLAPNGWLTLCPLVCEDLARLEPVSELIRGVGPNIIIAILMDGPQLRARWSARYVSVLADDPGSSVLTLTSLGMALQSRPQGTAPNRTIALWSDGRSGRREIAVEPEAQAVVLTVTADYEEEFTADGRSDKGNASVFELQGVHQLKVSEDKPVVHVDQTWTAKPVDVFELTAFTYFVDSVLDLGETESNRLAENCYRWTIGERVDGDADLLNASHVLLGLWELIREVLHHESRGPQWPQYDLKQACHDFVKMREHVHEAPGADHARTMKRWRAFVEEAEELLKRVQKSRSREENRADLLTPLTTLWAVHNRLSRRRRKGRLRRDGAELLERIEADMRTSIDRDSLRPAEDRAG